MCSGENAFDSGANIEVKEDGKYRLTLKTDAETLSLCSLSYERLGDADPKPQAAYDMKLWASFNDWAGQDMVVRSRRTRGRRRVRREECRKR